MASTSIQAGSSFPNYQTLLPLHSDGESSDSDSLLEVEMCPELASVLEQVIIREQQPPSQLCRTVAVRVSSVSLALLGVVIGTTFMYLPATSLDGEAWQITSKVGSVVAGIFPAYHWLQIGESWVQGRSPEETRLRYRYRSLPMRVVKVVADYALGIFTQFPLCEVFFAFNKNPALAPLEASLVLIGNASPTIESTEGLTEHLDAGRRYIQERFCCASPTAKEQLRVRRLVIKRIQRRLRQGLAMTREQRLQRFQSLYLDEVHKQAGPQYEELRRLAQELLRDFPEDRPLVSQQPVWHQVSSGIFQLVFGFIAAYTFDVIQTGGMTRDSAHLLTDDSVGTEFLVVAAIIAWLYVLSKGTGDAVVKTFGQMTDVFGVPRRKSFAEQFYPKMSKLANSLAMALAWLPLGAVAAIARPYYDLDNDFGKALYLGAVVSSAAVFQDAMSHLAEKMIDVHARSRFSDEEVRHARLFKDRIDRLGEVLSQTTTPDLMAWLNWVGDPELLQDVREIRLEQPVGP